MEDDIPTMTVDKYEQTGQNNHNHTTTDKTLNETTALDLSTLEDFRCAQSSDSYRDTFQPAVDITPSSFNLDKKRRLIWLLPIDGAVQKSHAGSNAPDVFRIWLTIPLFLCINLSAECTIGLDVNVFSPMCPLVRTVQAIFWIFPTNWKTFKGPILATAVFAKLPTRNYCCMTALTPYCKTIQATNLKLLVLISTVKWLEIFWHQICHRHSLPTSFWTKG